MKLGIFLMTIALLANTSFVKSMEQKSNKKRTLTCDEQPIENKKGSQKKSEDRHDTNKILKQLLDHTDNTNPFDNYVGELPDGLKEFLALVKDKDAAKKEGIIIPQIISLYGPRNTGKTLLINALVRELRAKAVVFNDSNFTPIFVNILSNAQNNIIESLVNVFKGHVKNSNGIIIFDKFHDFRSPSSDNVRDSQYILQAANQFLNEYEMSNNPVRVVFENGKNPNSLITNEFSGKKVIQFIEVPLPDENQRNLLWQHFLKQSGFSEKIIDNANDTITHLAGKPSESLSAADIKQVCQSIARFYFVQKKNKDSLDKAVIATCLAKYKLIINKKSDEPQQPAEYSYYN